MEIVVNVRDLETVSDALDRFPAYMAEGGPKRLYQVINTKPMNEVKRRTPRATTRRYTHYNRKDGKVTRVNKTAIGSFGTLRSALGTRVKGTEVEMGIRRGLVVPYAWYVHEAKKPREGQYWEQGMRGLGTGWTTKNTGNKYVERAVRNNADYIPDKLSKLIDSDLRGMGL